MSVHSPKPFMGFNKLLLIDLGGLRKALLHLGCYNSRVETFIATGTCTRSIEMFIEILATLTASKCVCSYFFLGIEVIPTSNAHQSLSLTMPKFFCLKLNWKSAEAVTLMRGLKRSGPYKTGH